MARWSESATIDAPAAEVYAYVSDFTNHARWSGHGLEVTQDDDGPVAVGTTFSTVASQFGTQRESSTITDLDPPTLFAWDSTGGLGVVHHAFHVAEADGVTTLTRTADYVRQSFLARMLGFRINRDLPASLRQDLDRITAAVEGRS